ncbi:MAG: glutamate--tRNA ligase [Oscillospiraceae bacterium]|nr:glutamate--tRNA ligase [Oscillospiraceae bacterium]
MDTTALANLLFPDITKTIGDYETIYPPRDLPEGAVVTRIAPSPTGFVHLGNLYNAIGERLAHQTGGVFYLRIEDTDQKREVEGAVEAVIDAMTFYGVHFDEGATADGETGAYGPYRQRQRKELYQTVAKSLVLRGLAYPCFCTEDDLKAMHEQQEAAKENYGYYGKYALWRDRSAEDIRAELDKGTEWVLRFRSEGDPKKMVEVQDGIRGSLKVQENYTDFVLLKSDGIPTYHFAHVCDDHFMRTTHVIRDESWLATLPIHVQLFDTLGWMRPVYCHTATLMKMDGSSKRKLSKRKDPELALSFYREAGFPQEATWLYLLTVLNSNFEEWHLENPDADSRAFTFSLEKMSTSGALFDLEKLDNICREYLSRQSADTVYDGLFAWAEQYDPALAARMKAKAELYKAGIGVGRGGDKPRKDYGNWRDAAAFLSFYDADTFTITDDCPENTEGEMRQAILTAYLDSLSFADTPEEWFAKVKVLTEQLGYAAQPKKYKKNPELFKGSIVDVTNLIRVALTGRRNAPDICEISHVLGETETRRRLEAYMHA